MVKKVGTIDGRQPLWTVGDGKTRSEGGSKVKRESQARGQSEKENILEKRGFPNCEVKRVKRESQARR